MCAWFFAACALGIAGGCPEDDDDTQADDDAEGDDDTADPGWVVQQVGQLDAGLQARLVVGPQGQLAVASWANLPHEDGICEEVPVDPPPRLRQSLYLVSRFPGDGDWTVETVDEPVVALAPTGLSLAFDGQERLAVAYQGGEPQGQYCGSNDAILAVRETGGWALETASTDSADHVTGEALSDTGFVVGSWPGLALDPAGEPAILHRDTHLGSMQSEDLLAADAEFAWRVEGVWTYGTVDVGNGGGHVGSLVFDTSGRPVAFHAVNVDDQPISLKGVWAARREAYESWTAVQLHVGGIGQKISSAVDPVTGDLVVAFYAPEDGAVRLRRLADETEFADAGAWDDELIGSPQYMEGQHVSLAFTPEGRAALAYRRCRIVTSGSGGCDPNDEAVMFAVEEDDSWSIEAVVEADLGSCGEYTSLGFSDVGVPHIAYRCTVQTEEGFASRLFVASREE